MYIKNTNDANILVPHDVASFRNNIKHNTIKKIIIVVLRPNAIFDLVFLSLLTVSIFFTRSFNSSAVNADIILL